MALHGQPIAIIGMAGRVPGARSIEEFRRNVLEGVKSISVFDESELRAAGATDDELNDPSYVRAAPVLGDIDMFDAVLFGLNAREAQLLDPQFRVFLETCHTALRQAGVVPGERDVRIGVYGGSRSNTYLDANIYRNSSVMRVAGGVMAIISNHTDYLATGVAYRLNLTGPAVSMVTACSTSLVAIHTAVQALRAGECDVALAGGVEIPIPEVVGYMYTEGGIFSPDGHVRPFDAKAQGTVFGSGCGVVVLKRLDAALAERNPIQAVIRGSAINNDGNDKSAFSAPSRSGQVAVVSAALTDAGVNPETIGYLEAHGTGTLVGDPVEVGALGEAFNRHTDRKTYCAIASVKANVGHLGAAAGVTGLLNAVCSVRDGLLAPVANFDHPNPRIDFAQSPFYINRELSKWGSGDRPRRALVNSFGIGGTNASVIIEQAPTRTVSSPSRRSAQLMVLSAHSPAALDQLTDDLREQLTTGTDNLADAAYTLTVGREALPRRRFLVVADSRGLVADLPSFTARSGRTATFLFPGQGSQHPGMAAELYRTEPVFRTELNTCATVLRESHGLNILQLLFEADADTQSQTCNAQPMLFAVEYALANTLRSMGIEQTAMAGHSVGEYVAATLAGVFTRDDALGLVARRGALMQRIESGAMLAVSLPEEMLASYLDGSVDIAALNAPGVCVVSGSHDDVRRLEDELSLQGITCRPLQTSHAFHSRMMDPICEPFAQAVRECATRPPRIPFVSSVTGTWIADDEATDPDYWVRHLRDCVRFLDTLRLLTTDGDRALIEVGPGQTLTGYVTAHDRSAVAVPTMRHPKQEASDVKVLLGAFGRLWAEGVEVNWRRFWGDEQRHLVVLPEYPYQRERYWIEPDALKQTTHTGQQARTGPYAAPLWLDSAMPLAKAVDGVWINVGPAGDPVLTRLGELAGEAGAVVAAAAAATQAVEALVELAAGSCKKVTVVHALAVGERPAGQSEAEYASQWLEKGFYSALSLLQDAVRQLPGVPVELILVSSRMQDVFGDGRIEPAKAAVLGLVKLAPKEMEAVTCRSVDFGQDGDPEQVAKQLFAEISGGSGEQVAYRGRKRWTWSYAGIEFEAADGVPARLKRNGVYVITGGLGGLGLVLARQLATMVSARIVLIGRNGLPDRAVWPAVLAESPDGVVARRIHGVQAAEEAGGQVLVIEADVTDEAQLRSVHDEVVTQFGPVDGVFHLAAVAGGGMLETRAREDAALVFGPKVQGTYVLDRVFQPDLMVLYSSIVVLSANFGQGDYAGANAVLDAFAQARWAEGRHVISINWPPFHDVGMAHGIGAPNVFHQIAGGFTEADGGTINPVAHPMLLGRSDVDEGYYRFEIDLNPASTWVLGEHQLLHTPTMPATGVIELIRAAHADITGDERAELSDLVFLKLLVPSPGLRAFLDMRRRPDRGHDVTLTGSDNQQYARCRVHPVSPAAGPVRQDLEVLRSSSEPFNPSDLHKLRSRISLGGRWNSIRSRREGAGLELVTIELAASFRADLDDYLLHPAMMDLAVAIGQTVGAQGNHLHFTYDRITMRGALPARVHAVIRHLDDTTGPITTSDIAIVDDDGNELVAVERFSLAQMPDDVGAASPAGSQPVLGTEYGVRPEDGEESLRRILGADVGPQIIWCPEGLDERMRRTARVNRSMVAELITASSGATGATRSLTTPYVEPESDLEWALAQLWADAFGVEAIGAEDDFFDLGGDSLIAVQLVSLISQRFSVDVTAAALFDACTVRGLAITVEHLLVKKVSALSDEQAVQAWQAMGSSVDG